MPATGAGGTMDILVGTGAGIGSSLGALALYWARRFSLSFWSWSEVVWAIDNDDMALDKSLQQC